jgi:hypothetical protein
LIRKQFNAQLTKAARLETDSYFGNEYFAGHCRNKCQYYLSI